MALCIDARCYEKKAAGNNDLVHEFELCVKVSKKKVWKIKQNVPAIGKDVWTLLIGRKLEEHSIH